MRIGIIVAMDKELTQLQSLFTDENVRVQKCGIGKVNAALGAQRMINDFHPDVIISSGCAGGNGDDVNIQDVVVSSQLTYHDVYCGLAIDDCTQYGQVQGLPVRYEPAPWLMEKALSLDCNVAVHPGLIVTGDWFVDTKEKMREIVGHFPDASAVDMESCAIAQTCYIIRCPLSRSASSATFRCAIPMPLSITTSGTPWPNTRLRSPRASSNPFSNSSR